MAGVLLLSEEEEVSRVEAMVGPKSEENGRRKYIPLLSLAPRALALYLNLDSLTSMLLCDIYYLNGDSNYS